MEEFLAESSLFSLAGGMRFLGMEGMKDTPSYEELIDPVRERMMRVIWRVVRHPEEAQDTMQEVLTIIWQKRDRILCHPNPRALILKICVNAAIDALRKQRRRGRISSDAVIERLADPAGRSVHERAETEALVKRALGRLPKKQAAAMAMRVLEGYSYKEIGAALGCREATARTHVLRARTKLSRWLSDLRPSRQEELSR